MDNFQQKIARYCTTENMTKIHNTPEHDSPMDNTPQPTYQSSTTTLQFSISASSEKTHWIAKYHPETENNVLGLDPGEYSLIEIVDAQNHPGQLRPAERLCSLPEHPHVLTVLALATANQREQIWYEPAHAGTLEAVLDQRGQLTGGETALMIEQISTALRWLHEQQMAYEHLSPEHIVFTLEGTVKLTAPDKDLRGSQQALAEAAYHHDISRLATIIWRCLTGEEPSEYSIRTPLKLHLPQTNPELGKVLETAIDRKKPLPELAEISSLLSHDFSPVAMDLFASAHPAIRPLLPARILQKDEETKTSYRKKSDLPKNGNRAQTRSLFTPRNAEKSPKKKGPQVLPLSSTPATHRRGEILRKVLIGGGILAIIAIGAYAIPQLLPSPNHSESPKEATAIVQTSPSITPNAPEPSSSTTATQEAIGEESSESTIHHLVNLRNAVLATGQPQRISEYAVEGSLLAAADEKLIQQDHNGSLAQRALHVVETEELHRDERTAVIRATVALPTASGEAIPTTNIPGVQHTEQGLVQTVDFTLVQDSDNKWYLEQAEPVTSGTN